MIDGRARQNTTRWALVFGLVLALSACGRAVTPAELDAYEAHSYEASSKDQVVQATVTALRSLGYEVVAVDNATGRIKTAPKVVVVHASRVSSSTAVASSDTLAWTIDVTAAGRGANLHAEPRVYSAGQALEATKMNSEYARRTFATLYTEIDSNLSTPATPSSASSSPKSKR